MSKEQEPRSSNDATLRELQKNNTLEQQLQAIRRNTEETGIQLLELQRELKKARRSIRIFWIAELLGPVLAIALILGGAWYALKYAEAQYLGGASVIDKFLLKEEKSKPPT
ncbi:hypothetical protein [Thiolapillus sp.]